MTLGDAAQFISAMASLGTLILAFVIWRLGQKTHSLVNGLSDKRVQNATDKGFAAGTIEGRLQRLEDHETKPPS